MLVMPVVGGFRQQSAFWLDLSGSGSADENDVGTIAQNVPTVVGRNYRLSFFFGGNPQCLDEAIKSMHVLLNGVVVGKYSINVTGVATDDAQWHRHSIMFTAKTSSTVVSFQSLKGVIRSLSVGRFSMASVLSRSNRQQRASPQVHRLDNQDSCQPESCPR